MWTSRSAIEDGRLVVRHDHGRRARLPRDLAQEPVHGLGAPGVELAGRLVGEQKARPVRDRRTDGDALLLAA